MYLLCECRLTVVKLEFRFKNWNSVVFRILISSILSPFFTHLPFMLVLGLGEFEFRFENWNDVGSRNIDFSQCCSFVIHVPRCPFYVNVSFLRLENWNSILRIGILSAKLEISFNVAFSCLMSHNVSFLCECRFYGCWIRSSLRIGIMSVQTILISLNVAPFVTHVPRCPFYVNVGFTVGELKFKIKNWDSFC